MKFLAILPIVLCMVALILTFLALFAGSRPGFMEDYAIITLNTSRFGENALNILPDAPQNTDNTNITNIILVLISNLTNSIEQDINDDINDIAHAFGLHDWYSLHVLDFCQGDYVPGPTPNATLSNNQIWKNVTNCTDRDGLLNWDPKAQLQQDLNDHGLGFINITELQWPDEVSTAIDGLHADFKATYILYCISVAFIFVAFFAAIASLFLLGRIFSFVNVGIDFLAFLAVMIASALVTVTMQEGVSRINKYGNDAGISAYGSSKMLAITWSATALMFVASCVWCLDCIIGRRANADKGFKHKGHAMRTDDVRTQPMKER